MGFLDQIFGGVGSSLMDALPWLLCIIPIMVLIIIVVLHFKNKSIYKYKVRIFRIRENKKVKESNFIGGYIGRKNTAPFFRIKTGKWWWNVIDLTTTPNVAHMDEEDRIYYLQTDINTFVQCKREMNLDDELIKYSPVESDVKYGAVLSIQRIKEVLRTESTWKKLLPYAGLLLVAVVLIIGYAILLQTKCP